MTNCILIFDVGKTNKKVLLFDQQYHVLEEESVRFDEIEDEDGFPCEDVSKLTEWILATAKRFISRKDISVAAVNFSGYGASFVCVDEQLRPVLALSNYLKPFPPNLQNDFYKKYGGVEHFTRTCASPALGNLNSGLQLYRIKKENPTAFKKIRWALHLPQYLSTILTGKAYSDMTSIGCHTSLWDFSRSRYHAWVYEEGIDKILAPIHRGDEATLHLVEKKSLAVGIGLHDSSAALVPYLSFAKEPFILVSTGTWNITLNPFNSIPLTSRELERDCLCYLTFRGQPVKASRLFAGHEHDEKIKSLAKQFNVNESYFLSLGPGETDNRSSGEVEAAYTDFMNDLVRKQEESIRLVMDDSATTRIFIDGGFAKNRVFMTFLSNRFPEHKLYAATVAQASALGAALAIHDSWNPLPVPASLIDLKPVSSEWLSNPK